MSQKSHSSDKSKRSNNKSKRSNNNTKPSQNESSNSVTTSILEQIKNDNFGGNNKKLDPPSLTGYHSRRRASNDDSNDNDEGNDSLGDISGFLGYKKSHSSIGLHRKHSRGSSSYNHVGGGRKGRDAPSIASRSTIVSQDSSILSRLRNKFTTSKNNKPSTNTQRGRGGRSNYNPYPNTTSHQSISASTISRTSTKHTYATKSTAKTWQTSETLFHNKTILQIAKYYISLPFRYRSVMSIVSVVSIGILVLLNYVILMKHRVNQVGGRVEVRSDYAGVHDVNDVSDNVWMDQQRQQQVDQFEQQQEIMSGNFDNNNKQREAMQSIRGARSNEQLSGLENDSGSGVVIQQKRVKELGPSIFQLDRLYLKQKSAIIEPDKDDSTSSSSSSSTLYTLKDSALYTNLQALQDIDTTIESNALSNSKSYTSQQQQPNPKCSRLFIYMPDYFAEHGHGSQINTYIMAITASTYMDRSMLLLEYPILEGNKYASGSQFGCPIDAFHEAMGINVQIGEPSSSNAQWSIRNDFPLGYSRLIYQPSYLTNGCSIPKNCRSVSDNAGDGTTTYDYADWVKLYQHDSQNPDGTYNEITCTNLDGSTSNVIITSGGKIRKYFRTLDVRGQLEAAAAYFPTVDTYTVDVAKQWAMNMGASSDEAEIFTTITDRQQIWDYILGLLNKAGFMMLQPWIARDTGLFLRSFDLPLDYEYSAIHVRRGDKLISEARGEVERYWKSQGYTDMDNLPFDYVPFAHYLSMWDGSEVCQTNQVTGELEVMKHNVYIATDDPIVIKQEIDNLDAPHLNENTVLWNDCHELTFYFNPTNEVSAFHLNGDGEKPSEESAENDNCFARYHRNIASIADMMILSKAKTFIGEYNSNWGRVIRTMRVRMNKDIVPGSNDYTRTLDTRIAWADQGITAPDKVQYKLHKTPIKPIEVAEPDPIHDTADQNNVEPIKHDIKDQINVEPMSVCGRMSPIPHEEDVRVMNKYALECASRNRGKPKDTSLLLLEGSKTYGRTGNNLIEFLHALQYAKDKNVVVGIMQGSWALHAITQMWMAIQDNEGNSRHSSDRVKAVLEWIESFEKAFCLNVVQEEDLDQYKEIVRMETRDLFVFQHDVKIGGIDEYVEFQTYNIRTLFRSYNKGVGINMRSRPVRDMCSVLDAMFGDNKDSAMYSVIHSRSLEGPPGERLLARVAQFSGCDPKAALDMEPEYIKAILKPLGMLDHPIIFITDNQRPEILEKLQADPEIAPQIQLVPEEASWVGGDMSVAIMSTVFIGNPASTFSGFIAKSRIALGFDTNYLFRRKTDEGDWIDVGDQLSIFDKKIMRSMA